MLFINSRPTDRAEKLSHALRMAQVEVVELALLELLKRPYSNELAHLYQQLPMAQIVVVVSPTAVRLGMDYLKQSSISLNELNQLQWIAVGDATAQALADYGITAEVPLVETSEGMLQLPILNYLKNGTKIAFWRGEGGRLFMMEQLKQQNMQILNFILYERRCPLLTQQNFPQFISKLAPYSSYIMLISSEASWLNWLDLMQDQEQLLSKAHYFVLGERLYQVVSDYKKNHLACFNVSPLSDLKADSILQQIAVVQGTT